MLPEFNRYHGAQAVGSSSDLYVLRPTPRTWRMTEKVTRMRCEGEPLTKNQAREIVDQAASRRELLARVEASAAAAR